MPVEETAYVQVRAPIVVEQAKPMVYEEVRSMAPPPMREPEPVMTRSMAPPPMREPEPVMTRKKVLKKSPTKKRFCQEGSYQNWTNSFSRMTVLWDKNNDLL